MEKKSKYTRNNPLNIRYSAENDWLGQVGERKGFCVFSEVKYGWRAGFKIVKTYHKKGFRSIEAIIHRFAPASENPTSSYVSFVSEKMQALGYESFGVEFEKSMLPLENDMVVIDLIAVMSQFETGHAIRPVEVRTQLSEWMDRYSDDFVIHRSATGR